MLSCYNYALFRTDDNVSIQLKNKKPKKAGSVTVHGVYIRHRLLPICYPFNFAQRILQNFDSKTFSLLFREHMGFLSRSIIYMQPGT